MILYLIRHAHSLDREVFKGRDMERPLTERGMKLADTAFRKFLTFSDPPSVILTSAAIRCTQTAEILKSLTSAVMEVCPGLNPGATAKSYLEALSKYRKADHVAMVGHEPDLSEVIGFMTGGRGLKIRMKKGAICQIEDGVLVNLIQQKVLL